MAAYTNIGEVAAQFNRAHVDPVCNPICVARGVIAKEDGDPSKAIDAALVRRMPFDLRAEVM